MVNWELTCFSNVDYLQTSEDVCYIKQRLRFNTSETDSGQRPQRGAGPKCETVVCETKLWLFSYTFERGAIHFVVHKLSIVFVPFYP